jgi:hypothetical protein
VSTDVAYYGGEGLSSSASVLIRRQLFAASCSVEASTAGCQTFAGAALIGVLAASQRRRGKMVIRACRGRRRRHNNEDLVPGHLLVLLRASVTSIRTRTGTLTGRSYITPSRSYITPARHGRRGMQDVVR